MNRVKHIINNINDQLSYKSTLVFNTMWMFYALLIIFGILPSLSFMSKYQSTMLYISNVIQLVSLPLLGVGTTIQSKIQKDRLLKSDNYNNDARKSIMDELSEIKDIQKSLVETISDIKSNYNNESVSKLNDISSKINQIINK